MKTLAVWVDDLTVSNRMRQPDAAKVDALAESMSAIGLQQPISVYSIPDQGGGPDDIILVAGLHRLRAAQKLGWEKIEAFDVDLSEADRGLWEIDENLMRSELSADEKREHLRRRKEIWEARQVEERGTSCPTFQNAGRGEKGFAAETAAATGMSKRQVNRYLAEPKTPKPVSPPEPAHNPYEAYNKWCSQMNVLWGRAPQEWRERWLEENDAAVFDQSRAAQ